MKTKKNDFIEIDFIARTKDDNKIFDLTRKEDAIKFNLHDEKHSYHSLVICLGYNDIIKGLDEELIDKEPGKYTIEVSVEKAFGKKTHNLIKLIPTSIFHTQNIKPFPGLKVNIDNIYGTVLSVSGGRTIVDFNHPLAGKDLLYEVEIKRIINDTKEKVESFLKLIDKDAKFILNDDKLEIETKLNDENMKKELVEEIKKRIPEIKEVSFKTTTLE